MTTAQEQRRRLFDLGVKWGFDNCGWSPRTRDKYLQRWIAADIWMRANRDKALIFAKAKDLQAYLFSTKPTARNRNNIRQALLAFFNFLADQDFRDDNPGSSLPRLPEPRSLPKALSVEQARQVISAARALGHDYEAAVAVFLYAGLRKTEARTLQWSMVDFDRGWLIFRGKGSKERVVPMHEVVARALTKQRLATNAHPVWVFPSPIYQDRPLSDTSMRHLICDVGDMAGVEGLHPHVFRHTFATRLIELGADLITVQEGLGHSDPKTTAIYIRFRPATLKEDVDKLDFSAS